MHTHSTTSTMTNRYGRKSSVIGAMMLILCGFLSGVFLTLLTATAKAAEFTEEEPRTVASTDADADTTAMIGTLSGTSFVQSSEFYELYTAVPSTSLFAPYLSSLVATLPKETLMTLQVQKAFNDGIVALDEIEIVEPEPEPLPINTQTFTAPSNLTVDQLNEMIDRTLVTYTNKAGSSIFVNSGQYLYDAAHKYNVNELFILAVGCYEGAWGTSSAAKNKNNSYGIMATSTRQRSYASVEEGIHAFCKLAREYYFDYGLTNASSFGRKYCPPNSVNWAGAVNSIFYKYASCIS